MQGDMSNLHSTPSHTFIYEEAGLGGNAFGPQRGHMKHVSCTLSFPPLSCECVRERAEVLGQHVCIVQSNG
jgi:hypothetical protein